MLMLQAQAKTREMIFFDNSYPFETCVVVVRCVVFWMLGGQCLLRRA
ncbi:hypothetical protein R20233_00383 [Ralstonia sp. LMG 32965]|nr:hypothetical protein R20233_00383 [Ralstonia sp. LMG 32965]